MKPNVVPHIFNRQKRTVSISEIATSVKQNKVLVDDIVARATVSSTPMVVQFGESSTSADIDVLADTIKSKIL